jgi:undecaprenyl-diphosphatase
MGFMDFSTALTAILLGILEGLTEFIPVSSTGHLILAVDLLGFQGPPGRVFEIAIQLGAILAVCWLYRAKIFSTAAGVFTRQSDRVFTACVLLGFLPAMVLGVLFHSTIKTVLFSPLTVSIALIVGGIVILVIERIKPRPDIVNIEQLRPRTAFYIGLAQSLALIPGVSRSGATIMGALMLGVGRKPATEFSFFLAIPTMFAAVVYDAYKNQEAFANLSNFGIIAIGFIAAFIAAMLVVKAVVGFVSRHGFVPFAIYRILVGSLMLGLLLS